METNGDIAKIDVHIDPEEFRQNPILLQVVQILSVVRPQWKKSDVRFKVFTEGISNQLVGYYEAGKFDSDVVLLRVYGTGTELMIDRQREIENIQILSTAGCCPPLYATIQNGIVYGFVYGKTLDENTVRDNTVKRLIAKEMCRMHLVKPANQRAESGLFPKLYRFLELLPESFNDPVKQKQYSETIKYSKALLGKELEVLKVHLESLNSPVVFCHNDLLLKNIIHSEKDDRCLFIDHEYAMYNYQAFDVGNHFCEYAGVDTVDFSRYPDKDYQLDWLKYFLQNWAKQNGRLESDVTDKEVEEFYVKVNKFALAAHFFWGLWALVQAKHSKLDFDFLDYARLKLDEYFARKEEFLSLQLPS